VLKRYIERPVNLFTVKYLWGAQITYIRHVLICTIYRLLDNSPAIRMHFLKEDIKKIIAPWTPLRKRAVDVFQRSSIDHPHTTRAMLARKIFL
jgi:hypothetical protein